MNPFITELIEQPGDPLGGPLARSVDSASNSLARQVCRRKRGKAMQTYLYSLIRYVPVMERMEPINVGVILQGEGLVDVRLSPHAAKRKEIDTAIFRQWRHFLMEEIRGKQIPLFQPEKTSPQFLTYLGQLCEEPVLLSRPLTLQVAPPQSFNDVLEDLYNRLVAPPETTSPAAALRPTGRFRQITEERQFLRRGMKRHAHVTVGSRRLWIAYRQVDNGQAVAMDKIEVNVEIGKTANEIERMPYVLENLPSFLQTGTGRPKRYVLLADRIQQPFTDQPADEFEAMRDELERTVEKVKQAGGEIVRTVPEAERLATELDRVLPQVQECAGNE